MDTGQYIHALTFYFMAAVILSSGVVVARARNLVYSAIGLLFTFFGIAGVYVFAHADFVAGVQIVVYVGGNLVLVMFGIMLTSRRGGVNVPNEVTGSWAARLIPVGVTLLLLVVVFSVNWQERFTSQTQNVNLWSSHDADAPPAVLKEMSKQAQGTSDEERVTEQTEGSENPGDAGSDESSADVASWGTIDMIGGSMMNKYLLAFEEISMLLLVALLGAVYLARRPSRQELEEAREALRELEEEAG